MSERDWLILRGRLRAFVSAAALPVVIGSMAGAAMTARPEDGGDESSAPSDPGASTDAVRVAQK